MLFIFNKSHHKIMKDSSNKLINKLQKKLSIYTKDSSYKFINKLQNKLTIKLDKTLTNPLNLVQSLQDKVNNSFKKDNNQVFLKQSRFWARSITWVLMGSSVFALGWISIAKTDEIIIAQGKLEPATGVIDVQMPLEGITQEILVKEGEEVKKDQILIKLDTQITQANNNALKKQLEINMNILEKLRFLQKEGAVSEIQFLQQKLKIEDIQNSITTNQVRMNYQKISSPANGTVFELQPKGPGYVAQATQPVLKIVPKDNLLAKVEIASRTIGFVNLNKEVEISIDSYPATDFGVLTGKITSIGSDALPPNPAQGKGYRFPSKIELDTQYLELKSGKQLPLQVGMSLTANIKLRKVTYLQLLLNKFTERTNSLKAI